MAENGVFELFPFAAAELPLPDFEGGTSNKRVLAFVTKFCLLFTFMACHEYENQLAGLFRQATKQSIPRNLVFVPSEPSPCESSSVLSSANSGPHLTPNAYENEHTDNLWTAIFRKVLKLYPMSHRQRDLKGILDFVSMGQKITGIDPKRSPLYCSRDGPLMVKEISFGTVLEKPLTSV